jgi:hypothetical protein
MHGTMNLKFILYCILGLNILSVCLPASLYVCLPACLPVSLSVCLSTCLSVRLSACLSVCLSVCQSVCQSVYLFACLPACLSLSLCLPACLSACPSVSLCLYVRPPESVTMPTVCNQSLPCHLFSINPPSQPTNTLHKWKKLHYFLCLEIMREKQQSLNDPAVCCVLRVLT